MVGPAPVCNALTGFVGFKTGSRVIHRLPQHSTHPGPQAKGVRAEIAYVEPLDRAFVFDASEPPSRVLFSISTRFPSLLR